MGYCCGTLSTSDGLTHESMDVHEDEGRLLCIHSVCVAEGHRRQGIALKLLRTYATFVQQSRPDLVEIRLICKEPLVRKHACAYVIVSALPSALEIVQIG